MQETKKMTKEQIIKKIAKLDCPEAYGFEGSATFSDCGKCIICLAKKYERNN